MLAVIFEVIPTEEGKAEYLKVAMELKKFLENRDGFISIERFQSLSDHKKLLSLSFWRDEESIRAWRNLIEHRKAQLAGKNLLFASYRIRVAKVSRDYTSQERKEAPKDSNEVLS